MLGVLYSEQRLRYQISLSNMFCLRWLVRLQSGLYCNFSFPLQLFSQGAERESFNKRALGMANTTRRTGQMGIGLKNLSLMKARR